MGNGGRTASLSILLAICMPVFGNSSSTATTNVTPCEISMSVPMHYARLLGNGSVWDPVGRSLYPPGTYWSDDSADPHVTWKYRGCPCLLSRPCLRKCCPVGEDMTPKGRCVPADDYIFNPNVTDDDGNNSRSVQGDTHFGLLFELACKRFVLDPIIYSDDEFVIRASDGYLSLPKKNVNGISAADFCLDYVHDRGTYLAMVCQNPSWSNISTTKEGSNWTVYVCSVAMLLSIVFLLITFFVYALIPDLRNTHGKSLMCHVSCLVMGYVFLALVQLSGKKLTTNNCIASAFVIEFSFLAAFFWMNIMCVDIYLRFRDFKTSVSSARDWETKRFLIYSLYAWGAPFAILMVSLIMDFAPGIPASFIKPEFGKDRCWFRTRSGTLVYFYGPVAVLLICNVVLFIITALRIVRIKKETSILMAGENRRNDDIRDSNKERFNLYLKLFIVMGINWLMEVISWGVGGPGYLWYLTDIGNTLQGFFIFLIMVWKSRIRNILLKKWRSHRITNRRQGNPIRAFWYSDGKVSSDS